MKETENLHRIMAKCVLVNWDNYNLVATNIPPLIQLNAKFFPIFGLYAAECQEKCGG